MSQCTRERVGVVANQRGFSPSCSVYAMHGQSDKVVTTIVIRLDSLSGNLTVQTMLPTFYEQGYDPIMMESQFSPQLVTEHLRVSKRRNIDGVVLFGLTGVTKEVLAHWQSLPALLARDARGFVPVYYDGGGAIEVLMQQLCDRGHRSISYLDVPHSGVTTDRRRHETYLALCKARELYLVAALPGLAMK